MKKTLFILLITGLGLDLVAQTPLSLDDCLRLAIEKNLTVRQRQLRAESAGIDLRQARMNRLPGVGSNNSYSTSGGRRINIDNNQYIDESFSQGNLGLGASVTVFNGFKINNQLKQADAQFQATSLDVEAAKNTLRINVVVAYFQVMSSEELYTVAQKQVSTSQIQVERLGKLLEAGTIGEVELLNLKAQLANDKANATTARSNLLLAKLTLAQFLLIDDYENMTLAPVQTDDAVTLKMAQPNTTQGIYEVSLGHLPDLKAAQMRLQSAQIGIQTARADYLPTLGFSAGVGTFFSSASPLTTGRQLDLNLNRSAGFSLSIPIFGQFFVRNRVSSSELVRKIAETDVQNVKLQTRQAIEQASVASQNALDRHTALKEQVEALDLAFAAAESRLTAGILNSYEYALAKTNLDRARANLVQTKYEYMIRAKILDFYNSGKW